MIISSAEITLCSSSWEPILKKSDTSNLTYNQQYDKSNHAYNREPPSLRCVGDEYWMIYDISLIIIRLHSNYK